MSQPPRLVFLLNSAHRRLQLWIAAQQARVAQSADAAPSAAQGGVLFVLGGQDGATMGQLAQALDLAPSAVSGLVQRMEALGWVARQPCADDARTQRVWLQPAGHAWLEPLRQATRRIQARLGAGFTELELQTVARWLRHVQQIDGDMAAPQLDADASSPSPTEGRPASLRTEQATKRPADPRAARRRTDRRPTKRPDGA